MCFKWAKRRKGQKSLPPMNFKDINVVNDLKVGGDSLLAF